MSKQQKAITATARVRVTIEVPTSNWGKDCTVEQIMTQAEKEAANAVQNHISSKQGWRVVGEPEVVATFGTRS